MSHPENLTAQERAAEIVVRKYSEYCQQNLSSSIGYHPPYTEKLNSLILTALDAHSDAKLDSAKKECLAVYHEHKKLKEYPFDMGGLAKECADRVDRLKSGQGMGK